MSEHSNGQPAPKTDFKQVTQPQKHQEQEGELEHLEFNPPEQVFDPERILMPTPYGTVDQELLSELSHSEQRGITEAHHQELDLADQFNKLRNYETEAEHDQDNYETRLLKQFNQQQELDLNQDH